MIFTNNTQKKQSKQLRSNSEVTASLLNFRGTVMQIEKALINDGLRVSQIS